MRPSQTLSRRSSSSTQRSGSTSTRARGCAPSIVSVPSGRVPAQRSVTARPSSIVKRTSTGMTIGPSRRSRATWRQSPLGKRSDSTSSRTKLSVAVVRSHGSKNQFSSRPLIPSTTATKSPVVAFRNVKRS